MLMAKLRFKLYAITIIDLKNIVTKLGKQTQLLYTYINKNYSYQLVYSKENFA